jgi:excinuclease ABC subunit B
MYADHMTASMQLAIDETNRRRGIQKAYNTEHHIKPKSITKQIDKSLRAEVGAESKEARTARLNLDKIPKDEYALLIKDLNSQMELAAANLEFEKAADLRDLIADIKNRLNG